MFKNLHSITIEVEYDVFGKSTCTHTIVELAKYTIYDFILNYHKELNGKEVAISLKKELNTFLTKVSKKSPHIMVTMYGYNDAYKNYHKADYEIVNIARFTNNWDTEWEFRPYDGKEFPVKESISKKDMMKKILELIVNELE